MLIIRAILAIMFGLDLYWWWFAHHRLRPLHRSRLWRGLLAAFMATMLLTLCTRMLRPQTARTINSWVPLSIVSAQYLWHLLVLPVAVIVPLVVRVGQAIGRGVRATFVWGTLDRKKREPAPPADAPPGLTVAPPLVTRRQFASAAGLAIPPLILGGAVGISLSQPGKFRLRSFNLAIPGLPPALNGMTIAHLSDFHVGRFMTPAMMRPVIDSVNDLKPDLVLITGDLIDYALIDLPPAIEELRRLRPSIGFEHGVAMCMGNHDTIENAPVFKRDVIAAGVPLAADSARTIDFRGELVQLLGLNWFHGDEAIYASVRRTMQLRNPDAFPILLAHHPHAFDEAARQGLPLTLAGHTHGGQLMATKNLGAGPIIFRYWSGVYRKPDGSQLVVSNGIGNWFPLRINAPAEVIKLTLCCGVAVWPS